MARKYKSRVTTDKLDLKIEQQKDALEKAKAKYEAEKEAFLWDLLDLSYTMECEPEDWESIELERIISREKDPVLKEALEDMNEFFFG